MRDEARAVAVLKHLRLVTTRNGTVATREAAWRHSSSGGAGGSGGGGKASLSAIAAARLQGTWTPDGSNGGGGSSGSGSSSGGGSGDRTLGRWQQERAESSGGGVDVRGNDDGGIATGGSFKGFDGAMMQTWAGISQPPHPNPAKVLYASPARHPCGRALGGGLVTLGFYELSVCHGNIPPKEATLRLIRGGGI